MSYYDDFEHDHYEGEPLFFNRRSKPAKPTWTTRDGEIIPINEMKDSHLQNTINYLTRKSFEWEFSRELAAKKGVDLGEMIVNKRTVTEWLNILIDEVSNRQEA